MNEGLKTLVLLWKSRATTNRSHSRMREMHPSNAMYQEGLADAYQKCAEALEDIIREVEKP